MLEGKQLGTADHGGCRRSSSWARCGSLFLIVAGAACGRFGLDGIDADANADADADADADDDGVLDEVDNCEMLSNADQENEDGDLFGDVCDPCPPFADLEPADDRDGDGVSGLCDPSPANPGDMITLFVGFNSAAPGEEITGNWDIRDGLAHSRTLPEEMDKVNAITWEPPASGWHTVAAKATVIELIGDRLSRRIGVAQQFNGDSPIAATVCVFGMSPDEKPKFVLGNNDPPDALVSYDLAQTDVDPGSSSMFFLTQIDAARYRCADSAAGKPLDDDSDVGALPGRIGIYTRSASASFEWVMIVSPKP